MMCQFIVLIISIFKYEHNQDFEFIMITSVD